ncbi:MAG: zinc metallopeptidase [Spirochaetaceae bacterium]|nr:zinc metallopeptidase [Spirochaetaceae bacterium]MBO7485791.1 zinc metallopeptidase [Spirochaetaceae bacterium]MBP5330072.1 zinc metallopeptidase [Spirochaetaceae bacterium]
MIDQYYLLLVLPALLISLFAQFKVKSTFTKYSQEINSKGLSGAAAASLLLRANDITDVRIEPVAGELTDNYNPTSKVLHLSEPVLSKTTIAAVGVAAHETGHAIQHAKGYGPLALRSMLVPVANIGSSFGPTMAIAGLLFGFGLLIDLGIILYACAVLFYVVTLPVEFNASSRALVILRETNSMTEEELKKVKKVLSAAAMTYVASALTAIASLLRLVLLSRNRRR